MCSQIGIEASGGESKKKKLVLNEQYPQIMEK
jgi:hypothetical protein